MIFSENREVLRLIEILGRSLFLGGLSTYRGAIFRGVIYIHAVGSRDAYASNNHVAMQEIFLTLTICVCLH